MIDTAELARIRACAEHGDADQGETLALIDELERAYKLEALLRQNNKDVGVAFEQELDRVTAERDENMWCKSKLIELRKERDSAQDELEKAQAAGQRQYDYNVEQIAKYAALEAERDSARALLREADGWLYSVLGKVERDNDWDGIRGLRALISKELGEAS